MVKYYLSYILAIILTAISQLLLKFGANKGIKKNIFFSFFNIYTLSGYSILLISTILSVFALQIIPLKITIMLLPLVYILVGFFSFIFLKESLSKNKLLGSIIIIIGIILFNFQF